MENLDYKSFYESLTGSAPYEFQIKVAELLLAGKNVILSVPTGAGKTWASVAPFLYAQQRGLINFPQKMIYSSPLRTLTNSIFSDIREKCKENSISILTGEYAEDRFFEKDIIFSTIDQTLSAFLSFPLSLSQKQANINAGALIGSYLVFDEFHLLDTGLSMATALGTIEIMKNLSRVCIMTATLTDDYLRFLKERFGFVIVSIKDFPEDIDKIKSLIPKPGKSIKKSLKVVAGMKLSASNILEYHKNKTIVICNRVEKAQQLFNDIILLIEKDNCKKIEAENIICLHSRFFDSDRKMKEKKLKSLFGKESNKEEKAILISTQVIEAGMDISCDVMHMEISPINSFLQRAGRCARFEGEYGDIFVYDVLDLEEKEKISLEADNEIDKAEIRALNNRYLPYNKDICLRTLAVLSNYSFLNEEIAMSLVNKILSEQEKEQMELIREGNYNIKKIKDSWLSCHKNFYRETIRDIQSVEIILIDFDLYKDQKVCPWKFETISVYRWSLFSWAKKMKDAKPDSEDWIFAKAELAADSVFDFDWAEKGVFLLKKLATEEIKNYYEYPIFVDIRYFGYSDAGLMASPGKENRVSPEKEQKDKERKIASYKKDSFYQHSKGLLCCFEKEFRPRLTYLFSILNDFWGIEIDWDRVIRLILCMHDYGKLNKPWQKIMRGFQKRKSENDKSCLYNPNEFLAHTDYDEKTDKELAKECKLTSKPAHAGIGAITVYQIVHNLYGEELAKAVSCAILRHHSVNAGSFEDFDISKEGVSEMRRLFEEIGIRGDLFTKEKGESLEGIIPDCGNIKEWITYFVFVRILRLCDQKATENLENYYFI
jgi:CRISPR-associated endonuclease/helicase Cas3